MFVFSNSVMSMVAPADEIATVSPRTSMYVVDGEALLHDTDFIKQRYQNERDLLSGEEE